MGDGVAIAGRHFAAECQRCLMERQEWSREESENVDE